MGLERTGGFETMAFCEIDPFCQKVLSKHWPEIPIYENIKSLSAQRLGTNGIYPDVITGGFPCQPASTAGKRGGKEDDRWLWDEIVRLVSEIRPAWVILENVPGLLSLVEFDVPLEMDSEGAAIGKAGDFRDRVGRFVATECLEDLEQEGYSIQPYIVPACAVDAKHRRDRVWIVAHARSKRKERISENDENQKREAITGTKSSRSSKNVADSNGEREPQQSRLKPESRRRSSDSGQIVSDPSIERTQRQRPSGKQEPQTHARSRLSMRGSEGRGFAEWETEPSVGRVVDGVPARVDRIKSLGNAVVPQIPEIIGYAILEAHYET